MDDAQDRPADRPFVYANMAMTADGKITSAAREYPRFTSRRDRDRMDLLRARADALLVGAQTIRADDPKLHVRDPRMREHRRSLGKPEGLLRVVVTRSGRIDAASRFFADEGHGGRIIATTDNASAEAQRALDAVADRAEIWKVGRDDVDLAALLARLRTRGVERLLVEGGGELNWALVRDDLLDMLYCTIAPALLGGREAPTLLEGEGLPMEAQRRLRLADVERVGDELFCCWAVVR